MIRRLLTRLVRQHIQGHYKIKKYAELEECFREIILQQKRNKKKCWLRVLQVHIFSLIFEGVICTIKLFSFTFRQS